jgi:hypothetical protein
MHSDAYAVLARSVLETVDVFTKIPRHETQVRPAKGRQNAESSRVMGVLWLRLQNQGISGSETASRLFRLDSEMA